MLVPIMAACIFVGLFGDEQSLVEASSNLAQVDIILSKMIDTFDHLTIILTRLRSETKSGKPYLDKLETNNTYAELFLKEARHSDKVSGYLIPFWCLAIIHSFD